MADEPTTPKTEEATDKADEPAAKADEPAAKADEPAAKADEPAAKADEPAAKADEPAAKPDEPVEKVDEPAAKPDEPVEKVDEPAAKPDEPAEKVEESVEKMDGSSSKGDESSVTSGGQSSQTGQSSTTSDESPVKKEVAEKKTDASKAKKAESSSSAVRGVRPQKREVPIKSLKDVRPVLQEALKQLKHPLIKKLEAQTGMKREMLFYIACGLIAFFLMFGPCNEAICNLIGIVYPAHQSLMAVRSKTKADDTQWLMYWCSFALFSVCDFVLTPFVGPLFVLLKVTCLLYLAVPQTYGAHNIYVSCVDPLMDRVAKRIKI
uniref:Receptor expression-enhancing protein n=1 Tax=Globodera rostochiensis TaxID=31243 RepID=A0A914H4F8_GLORO